MSFSDTRERFTPWCNEWPCFSKILAKNPKYDVDLVKKMAEGGGVGTDTVPALLTPGEFVVNKSSAQKAKKIANTVLSRVRQKVGYSHH